MWMRWSGAATGYEVVSHGSGFGERGQGGEAPPDFSALRWLQDVERVSLACLGVAVVMTNDHDFDRDEITHRNVKAVVKWFNATKGFGFVQLSEGAPDAFLHISVVERTGNRDLAEGTNLVCDLMQGRKGLQVAEIHSVEGGGRPSSSGYGDRGGHGGGYGDRGGHGGGYGDRGHGGGGYGGGRGEATEVIEGTVKFFNAEKGFGFVIPDNGGKDIFVSGRTLERYGISALQPNQRVRLHTRMGQKGPMAEQVELL